MLRFLMPRPQWLCELVQNVHTNEGVEEDAEDESEIGNDGETEADEDEDEGEGSNSTTLSEFELRDDAADDDESDEATGGGERTQANIFRLVINVRMVRHGVDGVVGD